MHVNRAFMRITGYQQDEVIGQRPSKFKSGRHGLAFYQEIFATLPRRASGAVKSGTGAKAGRSTAVADHLRHS